MIGLLSADVRHLDPLPGQALTEEDRQRLHNLGANGDRLDPTAWGRWTGSVENRQATAEEVLGGMRNVPSDAAGSLVAPSLIR